MRGRDYVIPEDIKELAPAVLCHRLTLGGGMNTEAAAHRMQQLLQSIPVPLETL